MTVVSATIVFVLFVLAATALAELEERMHNKKMRKIP
jgi:hypothetical protein